MPEREKRHAAKAQIVTDDGSITKLTPIENRIMGIVAGTDVEIFSDKKYTSGPSMRRVIPEPSAYSVNGGRIIFYPGEFRFQLRDDEGKVTTGNLTPRELKVLNVFVKNPGKLLSRQAILNQVWGTDVDIDDRDSVKDIVRRLRRKLEPGNKDPEDSIIYNQHGVGYRLRASVSTIDQSPSISQQVVVNPLK